MLENIVAAGVSYWLDFLLGGDLKNPADVQEEILRLDNLTDSLGWEAPLDPAAGTRSRRKRRRSGDERKEVYFNLVLENNKIHRVKI